jgi:hypothetical protein
LVGIGIHIEHAQFGEGPNLPDGQSVLLAQRQGLAQGAPPDVGVVPPGGVTDQQQGFTGDVEAAVLQGERRRALALRDCLDPSIGQCCMGSEDRELDISRFSELLKPREKGRRFDV